VVVIDDELARTLLRVGVDSEESEELRVEALLSLGPALEEMDLGFLDEVLDEPPLGAGTWNEIREGLRGLYLDPSVPKIVRRRALEASIRSPREWHRGAVRAAYHDGDPEWRITALFCMGYLMEFEERIVESLESDDPRVRFEAVRAAVVGDLEEAWRKIQPILLEEDPHRDVLLAAIESVYELCPEAAEEHLGPFLDAPDPQVADAAAHVIRACLERVALWQEPMGLEREAEEFHREGPSFDASGRLSLLEPGENGRGEED